MIEIILTSSVLILIIAALRRILKDRISPTLQYALWLLVAVRLLIPGTLFSAPVTLVGLAEEIGSVITASEEQEQFTDSLPSTPSYAPGYVPDQVITIPSPSIESPVGPNTGTTVPNEPDTTISLPENAINVWKILWIAGSIAVGSVFLISNLIFYWKLRRSAQLIPKENLPFSCPVPVYHTDRIASPCLFGLRNAIYLNSAAIHPDRISYVLTHELTHRRHGDQFWALLRCVCLSIHWYNPLVWWAGAMSRQDCEMSCDSAVLKRLGDQSAISYGETLMAMLTAAPISLLHTATTMSAGKSVMAERLRRIIHRPKMTGFTLAIVALITAGAVAFTFGGCAQAPDTSEQDSSSITPESGDTTPGSEGSGDTTDKDDGKLDPPPNGFGAIPTYIHPSGLFSTGLAFDLEEFPVVVETEDGISLYAADKYQNGSEDGWILSIHPQPADWTGNQSPTISLAAFDPNGTPQVYVLEYSSEYASQYAEVLQIIEKHFVLYTTAQQFSRLIHDSFEEDITLAISYLPYLSWRNYREVYGEDALMPLLSALWKFADSGIASWDQYHDILSTTDDGLDGAYSEGLSGVFEALFIRNQKQFLSVINSEYITDAERARVAAYVKYGLGSEPDKDDSQEVTFNDNEVIHSLARAYSPTVWSTGSPTDLTLTLTEDWTLEGIKAALFSALSAHISGTLLEGDLNRIEIAYSFHFPEEMHDGVVFIVPFHATYVDQDVYTLPSGASHSPSSRTGELTATVQLVGEGITAPPDESFARGQAIYDQLFQLTVIDEVRASISEEQFQLLDEIHKIIHQRLQDAGLTETCRTTSFSNGSYYNPLWCDPGYEQTVEYTVSIMYTEGNVVYQYNFSHHLILKTTE